MLGARSFCPLDIGGFCNCKFGKLPEQVWIASSGRSKCHPGCRYYGSGPNSIEAPFRELYSVAQSLKYVSLLTVTTNLESTKGVPYTDMCVTARRHRHEWLRSKLADNCGLTFHPSKKNGAAPDRPLASDQTWGRGYSDQTGGTTTPFGTGHEAVAPLRFHALQRGATRKENPPGEMSVPYTAPTCPVITLSLVHAGIAHTFAVPSNEELTSS